MKKLLLALAFAGLSFGIDISKLTPTGYVNDFAHALDPSAAAAIETYCANVERATGAQFAVVLVESLDDDTVEDVAVRLFEKWGIGKKGTDEGLLLLLAIKDRKNRIEVGYGLEPIITDGQAGDVLRAIRPILRQGDYGKAIYAAVLQLGSRVAQAKGVTIDGQAPVQRRESEGFSPLVVIAIFFLIIGVLSALGGGRRGGPRGGGDILAGMILGQLLGGRRHGSGWSHGGFGGSGGGGGWSGGGGFGGFGGGGSGGGGASGGW